MKPYDFDSSIGYWVSSTAHALSQRLNEELADHGMTVRQWEVLFWLSQAGQCSQSDLAQRMHIEAPTLVGVLDRMERDGWIVRVPDQADRRKKWVKATDQVEPIWEATVQCALRIRRQAISGIPEEHLQILRSVLETMRKNLQAGRGGAEWDVSSSEPQGNTS